MSGSSGSLCRVPVSNCGLCFSELGDSGVRRWTLGSVSLTSRLFLADNRKLFAVSLIGNSGGVGSVRIQALQTDEERRRLRSKSLNYTPRSPSDPDLDELPLLRGGSRRNPNMEEDGGFDEEEDDNRSQPLLALWRGVNRYILAGIFVLGMGAGITVDTVLNVEPNNVASREVIDRQTPNPDVCIANGMSAMVLDQRLFISFNPFNVYVSQTEVKPGCVLRQSNWSVLEARGLVTSDEVRACKRNMNTFGFVGDLRQAPEISCVYHSESAENQFLKDPSKATLALCLVGKVCLSLSQSVQRKEVEGVLCWHNRLYSLTCMQSSLRQNGDVNLAGRKLKDLIRLVETFGFYCCDVDVRQESRIHSEATNEIMRLLGLHSNYRSLPEAERMKLLAEAISTPPPVDKVQDFYKTMTEPSKEVVDLYFACADIMENIS